MTKTDVLKDVGVTGRDVADLHFFPMLVLLVLCVRLAYAAMVQLVPDEALYWVWSRHLSNGYLDHPPMIAYLIWAGTHVLGSSELGVRVMGVLMAVGAMAGIVLLARRVLHDSRAAVWVAAMWLTSPLLAGLGTFFTPDTPAAFFSVCALACATIIADRDDQSPTSRPWRAGDPMLWILFGLFAGLGLLSKYPSVLLPASVALAMLFSPKGRAHYRRPWIYLSGIVALAVFFPDIQWNAAHHWASYLFQLRHGAQNHRAISSIGAVFAQFGTDLGTYVGEQAGVWTPILFGLGIVALVAYWRRYRDTTQVERVLLWSGTLPLVFFGVMFVKSHHGEANWPAFAYFPISILTARWLSEKWSGIRLNWAHAGVRLALGIVIGMHILLLPRVTDWMLRLPYRFPHGISDLSGWRQYGRELGREASRDGVPVVANRYEDAAEAAFYMPGQPWIWCVGIDSRRTAFDYFDGQPDFARIPSVLWVGGHVRPFEQKYGYVEQSQTDVVFFSGRNARTVTMYLLARPR